MDSKVRRVNVAVYMSTPRLTSAAHFLPQNRQAPIFKFTGAAAVGHETRPQAQHGGRIAKVV
jgi:hypothetical protein